MAHIVLDQWDAVELFCRVLVKYNPDLTLEQFHSSDFLTGTIDSYTRKKSYIPVTLAVFGESKDDQGQPHPSRPKGFYELSRKIKHNEPAVLPDVEYKGFMKYVGLDTSYFQHRKTGEWKPHKRRKKFENTKWVLYYLHRDVRDIKSPTNQPLMNGIATALLELKHFGKAEITGFKESECYEGKFEIYNDDGEFIRLNMTLKEHRTKDLSMLFYVGTSLPELCLGQYHNLGRSSIYSGTMMLEPLSTSDEKRKIPAFHLGDDIRSLPPHVQTYFSEKTKNMLRVPCKVTTISDFDEWQKVYKASKARSI